jgi:hypothetical protein
MNLLMSSEGNENIKPNSGSFRDPVNRVYEGNGLVLRGLNNEALVVYSKLASENFFQELLQNKQVVGTKNISGDDNKTSEKVIENGWAGVLTHEPVPFISYPYEWTFSMLKDVALLHLHLMEKCLENNWIFKDATPYNIHWFGAHPTFIDIPSFEPWSEGAPWAGYRQFCAMFLTPLMLKAHADIDYIPLMRSQLDGIEPTEAIKFFRGINRYKAGVTSHIYFPAKVEQFINKGEKDNAPAKKRVIRKQSKAMVLGLVQSLTRLLTKLKSNIKHTAWSQYDKNHSYENTDFSIKKGFVSKYISSRYWLYPVN